MSTKNAKSAKVWRRIAGGLLALLLALSLAYLLGPRNAFGPDEPTVREWPPVVPEQLDAWLVRSESSFSDIRPGTAKGVVWRGAVGQRTPWAVVYLHGFSASRLELAPLPEQVAQQLNANVFYTRLSGNGRTGRAMGEATAQDWLADAAEAVRIGRTIGDKVLVIATSTGGTLGTWLATHPQGQGVTAYVFVSPNYGPKDKRSELINGPWGQQLALALEGDVRGQVSGRADEALAWTERYATQALFPMMALVKHVRESDLSAFQAPVLVLYSRKDQTVDPQETANVFARFGSTQKTLEEVTYSESPTQHVLAGDIRAPKATARMVERIVAWVSGLPNSR